MICGQIGRGFITDRSVEKYILGFEPIDERICKLRIKGKFHDLLIIIENVNYN
jgi:hypothetical protein